MAGRLYTHWHPIPESDLHRPSLGSELFVHVLQNELLGPGAKPKAGQRQGGRNWSFVSRRVQRLESKGNSFGSDSRPPPRCNKIDALVGKMTQDSRFHVVIYVCRGSRNEDRSNGGCCASKKERVDIDGNAADTKQPSEARARLWKSLLQTSP